MSPIQMLIVVLAGAAAGAINAVVGSGSLITFPALLLLGLPPLTANMSSNIGLLPGGLSGAYGYRRELRGQRPLIVRIVPPAILGGLLGAILLLVLPASVFAAVVPVLVLFGLVMVALGPRLQKASARRAEAAAGEGDRHTGGVLGDRPTLVLIATFLTAVYGGYFGAAQGIIFVGLMSVLLPVGLQRINAVKNVAVPLVNLVAAVLFVTLKFHGIDWGAAGLIGLGSVVGGYVGSHLGRRLPPNLLRATIIVIGLGALARLFWA